MGSTSYPRPCQSTRRISLSSSVLPWSTNPSRNPFICSPDCVASPSVYPGVVTKRRRRRLQCRSTDKRSWVHGALRRRRESEAFRPAGGGGMYTGRPGMYYSLFLLVILRTPPGQQLSIWNATPPRSSSTLFRPRPSIWVDRPRVVERGMDPVSGYYGRSTSWPFIYQSRAASIV